MKIKFLIQGKQKSRGSYEIICHGKFFKNLTVEAPTFDDGVAVMDHVLRKFMETRGMAWIERWKGNPETVNCPEAYIQLPSDIWKCKITKDSCGLQAQVYIKNKQRFFNGCNASEDRKEKIFKTIKDGKYSGFHHVAGRHLCVQCAEDKRKKLNEHYHYIWELVSISDSVDFSGEYKKEDSPSEEILDIKESTALDEQLREEGYLALEEMLERKGFEPLAAGYGVCPKCCERIISAVFPEIENQLRVLELDFHQR